MKVKTVAAVTATIAAASPLAPTPTGTNTQRPAASCRQVDSMQQLHLGMRQGLGEEGPGGLLPLPSWGAPAFACGDAGPSMAEVGLAPRCPCFSKVTGQSTFTRAGPNYHCTLTRFRSPGVLPSALCCTGKKTVVSF